MHCSKFRLPLFAAVLGLLFAGGAQAQATRTWVSGVGDDANPCSRTAPCKTFAGAISKTAAGGEISVLDPGGFGSVTITKSITINGEGTLAGILAAGTQGIIVNAGVNDVVTIRSISINGAGSGLNGIRFLAGKELHVDGVSIEGFTQNGIDMQPSGTSALFVNNSDITRVVNTSLSNAAILVKPGAAGSAFVVVDNSRIEGNFIGMRIEDRSRVQIQNSQVSRNTQFGAWVLTAAAASNLVATDSVFAFNGAVNGVATGTALRSEGANSTIRLSGTVVTGSQLGLAPQSSGAILSYSDNRVSGNVTDGAPTGFSTKL